MECSCYWHVFSISHVVGALYCGLQIHLSCHSCLVDTRNIWTRCSTYDDHEIEGSGLLLLEYFHMWAVHNLTTATHGHTTDCRNYTSFDRQKSIQLLCTTGGTDCIGESIKKFFFLNRWYSVKFTFYIFDGTSAELLGCHNIVTGETDSCHKVSLTMPQSPSHAPFLWEVARSMILFGFQNHFYTNLGLKHFSYFLWSRGPIIITYNGRKCDITKHIIFGILSSVSGRGGLMLWYVADSVR